MMDDTHFDDRDRQVAAMLGHWTAPAPRDDAVAQILAAAGTMRQIGGGQERRRFWALSGSLAAALALVIGVWSQSHRPVALPAREPVLEADAMSTFFATSQAAESDEDLMK